MKKIPVARPTVGKVERDLVMNCLETTWISSAGQYVDQFERDFADSIDARHAISVSNGTCALHLALLGLDLQPGDEVIVPAVTYIATANAVRYCGGTVVLADVDPVSLNVTPGTVAAVLSERTRAIMPVHLFGLPCDIAEICALAADRGIHVVEDAAEAVGSRYDGRCVGTFGAFGTFSFFGNKTITTGEGGMLVTNDDEFNARCRLLRGQGMSPDRRYWHPVVGYNYRMTNICAAIGIGQLQRLGDKIDIRRRLWATYQREFTRLGLNDSLLYPLENSRQFNSVWMVNVLLADRVAKSRDEIMHELAESGIETRPTFYPLYQMPPYAELDADLPGAERAMRGITLPTFEELTEEEIVYIAEVMSNAIHS